MSFAGFAAEARMAIATGVLLLSMSGGGCSRPPLPQQDGVDANPIAPAFLAVTPCPDEAAYATSQTVVFGFLGTPPGFAYDPKCLTVDAGQTVTFSGSFAAHPLYPSTRRGTLVDNPIGGTSTGDRKDIRFPVPGFFAYYCGVHGGSDDGSTMAGVVWVR